MVRTIIYNFSLLYSCILILRQLSSMLAGVLISGHNKINSIDIVLKHVRNLSTSPILTLKIEIDAIGLIIFVLVVISLYIFLFLQNFNKKFRKNFFIKFSITLCILIIIFLSLFNINV